MPLYRNTSGALHAIQEQPFKLEKEIQTLVEENLAELMSLELVKSEFRRQKIGALIRWPLIRKPEAS